MEYQCNSFLLYLTNHLNYLEKAWKESGYNYTKAAKLSGLSNYQTFKNRLNKYMKG